MRYLIIFCMFFIPLPTFAGNCDYSWQRDSAGRRCGGRAANVRPGGRLGGTGHYIDSYERPRIYGRDNDPYDDFNFNYEDDEKDSWDD